MDRYRIIVDDDEAAEVLAGKEVSIAALRLYFRLRHGSGVALETQPFAELLKLGLIELCEDSE